MSNESTLTKAAADTASAVEEKRPDWYYRPHVYILEKDDEPDGLASVPGPGGTTIG